MACVVIEQLNDRAPGFGRLGNQVLLGEFRHVQDDRLLGLRHAADWIYSLAAALFRFRFVRDTESENRSVLGDVQDVQLLPADLGRRDSPERIGGRLARPALKLLQLVALQSVKRSPDL